METNFKNLEDLKKRKPFRVPDGYFEDFTAKMMNRLPEKEPVEELPKTISLLDRIKPWLYMAACFVGLIAAFNFIHDATKSSDKEQLATVNTSAPSSSAEEDISAEDAEFLKYLEEMYADKYASYYYLEDML